MVEWHMKDNKLPTGGTRNTVNRVSKKKAWMGGSAALTKTDTAVTKTETKAKLGRGTTTKIRAIKAKYANVMVKGKAVKADIVAVKTNDANRLYARGNISTKGAIIRVTINGTEKLAKVTSRPGQTGTVNAVLVE